MSPQLRFFQPRVTDEYFERVAWICIREGKRGAKEVLFVCSPIGDRFMIPGGRSKEVSDDKFTLIEKIKLDLNVDLIPESVRLFTSFAAPAYGKEEGVMVANKYFFADRVEREIETTPQIYAIKWLPIDTEEELTEADIAVMQQLYSNGIIN